MTLAASPASPLFPPGSPWTKPAEGAKELLARTRRSFTVRRFGSVGLLTSLVIPLSLVETPPVKQYALQPLPGTPLNIAIGTAVVAFLSSLLFSLIEVFAPRHVAEAWLKWMYGEAHEGRAEAVGQATMFKRWKKGIDRFIQKGGWDGLLCSLIRYGGESDGHDHLPASGRIQMRPFDHFQNPSAVGHLSLNAFLLRSLALFSRALPHLESEIDVTISFVSSAATLPTTLSRSETKRLEALIISWSVDGR
ncbi:hypothetical protein JCM11641_003903 [Rhodosporidiobolus odoratus]